MPESQANVQSQTLKPTSTSSLLFQSVCLKLINWNIDYFQSSDGRLRLFQCDFLHLTEQMVGGRVDAVWDTQSLVSINPRDRKQYVRTVKLVSTHQTYLKIIKHLLLKSMKEDRSKQLTILIPCFRGIILAIPLLCTSVELFWSCILFASLVSKVVSAHVSLL